MQLRDLLVWSNFLTTANFCRVDYVTKLRTCTFLVSKCSIQSYFDVFLLEHPWQRQFPVLVPRRYDNMSSDDVMILAPARHWRHTFRAVFSCSFLPKEFICFVFTTWLCEQHSHIVWMVPCQVNRCFIIQYITRQNHIYCTYTQHQLKTLIYLVSKFCKNCTWLYLWVCAFNMHTRV